MIPVRTDSINIKKRAHACMHASAKVRTLILTTKIKQKWQKKHKTHHKWCNMRFS